MTATIFPSALNVIYNTGHDENSRRKNNECKIDINTAYCLEPTEFEQVALTTFVAFSECYLPAEPHYPKISSSISRRVEHHQQCVLGTDKFFKYLCSIDVQNVIHIISCEWIQQIVYHQNRPAIGRGCVLIRVFISPSGAVEPSGFCVLSVDYEQNVFRSVAKSLSEKFSVPLKEIEDDDI